MGRVYEDAVVTLVAASGSDANHSLPGVPGRPRKTPLQIVLDGCIISEMVAPISQEANKSVWASRGWTYQEQFFSRRLLIFAPQDVSLECRRVQFSMNHGIRYRGDYDFKAHVKKPLTVWSEPFKPLREDVEWSGNVNMTEKYDRFLDQYWPRHLLVGDDGINTFAAVLESLKNHWNEQLSRKSTDGDAIECRMTFTTGMPHLIRHHEGSPEPSLDLFVHGMSWHSIVPMRRREHFPSWCWAGWAPSESAENDRSESGEGASPESTEGAPYELAAGTTSIWVYTDECKALVHSVFFLQNTAAGSTSSGHETIMLQHIPIAEHDLLRVPSAVIFDAPLVPPSAISWPKQKLRLWNHGVRCSDYVYTLDRGVFLEDITNEKCCVIALARALKSDVWGCYGPYVFLLVRRVDQCRYERVSAVLLVEDSSVWQERLSQERLDDVRTWELI